jgi:hypothetical protein
MTNETVNQALELTKAAIASNGPKWGSNVAQVIIFLGAVAKKLDEMKDGK